MELHVKKTTRKYFDRLGNFWYGHDDVRNKYSIVITADEVSECYDFESEEETYNFLESYKTENNFNRVEELWIYVPIQDCTVTSSSLTLTKCKNELHLLKESSSEIGALMRVAETSNVADELIKLSFRVNIATIVFLRYWNTFELHKNFYLPLKKAIDIFPEDAYDEQPTMEQLNHIKSAFDTAANKLETVIKEYTYNKTNVSIYITIILLSYAMNSPTINWAHFLLFNASFRRFFAFVQFFCIHSARLANRSLGFFYCIIDKRFHYKNNCLCFAVKSISEYSTRVFFLSFTNSQHVQ